MSNRPVLSTTCDGRCKALDRIVVHVTRYRLFVCLTQCSQWRTVWTYILALGYIHTYCRPHHLTQQTGVHVCSCRPYAYMQYMWPLSTVTHYCILHKDSQFTIYIHTYVYGRIIHECTKATQPLCDHQTDSLLFQLYHCTDESVEDGTAYLSWLLLQLVSGSMGSDVHTAHWRQTSEGGCEYVCAGAYESQAV